MTCLRELLLADWHGVPVGVLAGAVVFAAVISAGLRWFIR